jgi:hypothetical protein
MQRNVVWRGSIGVVNLTRGRWGGVTGSYPTAARRYEPPSGELSELTQLLYNISQSLYSLILHSQDALDALECDTACNICNIYCLKADASSLAIGRAQSIFEYVAWECQRSALGNMAYVLYRSNSRFQWPCFAEILVHINIDWAFCDCRCSSFPCCISFAW